MKYVHKDVYVVCTNGMHKSQLDVADRKTNIVQHRYIATAQDKPIDFGCKWIGILLAALAAFILVFFMAAILAVLLATIIGILGAAFLSKLGGGRVCNMITRGAQWQLTHPKVKVKGIAPLLENSTLPCSLGGTVFIYYSKEAAEKQALAFAVKNSTEMLVAAGVGAFAGANVAVLTANATLGAKALSIGINFGFVGLYYMANKGLDKVLSPMSESLGQYIYQESSTPSIPVADGQSDMSPSNAGKTKSKDNEAYKEPLYPFDDGMIAIIKEPAKVFIPNKLNEEPVSAREIRQKYLEKPRGEYDKNGTYRRPRSLREINKANINAKTKGLPRDQRLHITRESTQAAKKTAYLNIRKSEAWKSGKGAVGSFLAMTAINFIGDVTSSYFQAAADAALPLEAQARAGVTVQAQYSS